MKIEAVVFDVYGTLIDILTDEGNIETYKKISSFLKKYDFIISPKELKEAYFGIQHSWMSDKRETYGMKYPEIQVVEVWEELMINYAKCLKRCPTEMVKGLAETLPLLFRNLTLRRKALLPYVIPTLDELNRRGYKLSIISNAQAMITIPELNEFGLVKYFYPIVLSSTFGIKKPENLLFKEFMRKLKLKPGEIVFVGNDMRDDIYGAQRVGMRTIFVDTPIGLDEYKNVKPDISVRRMDKILKHL